MAGLTFTNAATNIVFDGNSIIAGSNDGTATLDDRIGELLMQLAPINGAMTYKNIAQAGATWDDMAGGGSSGIQGVHNAFEPGKQNLLFPMEGVNSAQYGWTTQQIIDKCKNYIDQVHAVHPEWRVFLIISPPFREDVEPAVMNAAMDGFNDYIRQNYRLLGAEGYVETRPPGGPLAYTSYKGTFYNFSFSPDSPYVAGSGLYADSIGVHLNARGSAVMAQYIADMLLSIPDVAPAAPSIPSTPSTPSVGARSSILTSGAKPLFVKNKLLRVS